MNLDKEPPQGATLQNAPFEAEQDVDQFRNSDDVTEMEFEPYQEVRRALDAWQIFFIVISGTIGMGLFDNCGLILSIAGPSGTMLSYGLVSVGVICVMEGISEMVGHWPVSNAMVEFVRSFVDEELSWVVGFAYWAANSISFATLIVAASNLAAYYDWPKYYQVPVFMVLLPVALLILNCLGVKLYGNVESLAGALKLVLVFISFVIMLVVNHGVNGHQKIGSSNIQAQFQNNPKVAATPGIAALVGIPIAAFAFMGVETVAVAAVEARDPARSLRLPSQWIAYIISTIYLLSVGVFVLNVSWTDSHLPGLTDRKLSSYVPLSPNSTTTVMIIAVKEAGKEHVAAFLNGFLIVAILSTANTALYVASRTLFGLAKEWNSARWYHRLGTTHPSNQVPLWALLATFVAFCWVPFLHLGSAHYSEQEILEIMSGIATVTILLVWGSQCAAYIRYYWWLNMHRPKLVGETWRMFDRFGSRDPSAPFSSLLAYFQPLPAIFGLIFCFLTVFFFSTASWWNGMESSTNVVASMITPGALISVWLFLKWKNSRLKWGKLWVPLSTDWLQLRKQLIRLNVLILDDDEVEPAGTLTKMLSESKIGVKNTFKKFRKPSAPVPMRNLSGSAVAGHEVG